MGTAYLQYGPNGWDSLVVETENDLEQLLYKSKTIFEKFRKESLRSELAVDDKTIQQVILLKSKYIKLQIWK